jgi:hypothetical protein
LAEDRGAFVPSPPYEGEAHYGADTYEDEQDGG